MREILFRGKRKDNGKWVDGFLYGNKKAMYILDSSKCKPSERYGEIILETIGQYTGLTDKNGKKIFEGDVVSGKNGLGAVNYNNGCFCIKGYNYKSYFNNPAIDVVMNEDFIEVIGNIYDNPELLEV